MKRIFTETIDISVEADTDAELAKVAQALALSGALQTGVSHAVMPSVMRQIFAEMPPMQINHPLY
ncbi:MAG: hypothetical protein HYR84_01040 [Planctomycetes bacterium]|nr:hypothetical protein [Planctomycetota bacterium]